MADDEKKSGAAATTTALPADNRPSPRFAIDDEAMAKSEVSSTSVSANQTC
jgi:hypothetical protein